MFLCIDSLETNQKARTLSLQGIRGGVWQRALCSFSVWEGKLQGQRQTCYLLAFLFFGLNFQWHVVGDWDGRAECGGNMLSLFLPFWVPVPLLDYLFEDHLLAREDRSQMTSLRPSSGLSTQPHFPRQGLSPRVSCCRREHQFQVTGPGQRAWGQGQIYGSRSA